jgi:hypothetical protein
MVFDRKRFMLMQFARNDLCARVFVGSMRLPKRPEGGS